MKNFTILLLLLGLSVTAFAKGQKVAVVKLLRGDVDLVVKGKTTKLKMQDWVEAGAVVKTAEKSFVKLVFIDKSQMNVGPNSEMRIESFSGKDSGVIDLVKGKIRSQVTKDYLQMKDKDRSKLFIKTDNAVMGVRGTSFEISTNKNNTWVVLFEGEVVFNRVDRRISSPSQLENIVNRGVRLFPGEFSVMERGRTQPTVPSLLNVRQREAMEKNESFESDRGPSNTGNVTETKSVVPEGLNGQVVSNSGETLKKEVDLLNPSTTNRLASVPSSSNPDGYVAGDKVKPANGSYLHVESGVIIPPGPGSVLDANTNTYIPGPGNGVVGSDGSYVPPKNVEITNDGKIFVAVKDASGSVQVQEVEKPVPVQGHGTLPLNKVGEVIGANPQLLNPKKPVSNDILNASFIGGASAVSSVVNPNDHKADIKQTNIIENVSNRTRTTIIVQPDD